MSNDRLEKALNELFDAMPNSHHAMISITRNEEGHWYNVAVLDERLLRGEVMMVVGDPEKHRRAHGGGETVAEAVQASVARAKEAS